MPTYKITLDARRTSPTESRRFPIYIKAETPRGARATLGNRPVVDPADGRWFDEWIVADTRKARVFEVRTTDNTAWHSNCLTGITVFYDQRKANTYLRRTLAARKPGQGAYLRDATNDK